MVYALAALLLLGVVVAVSMLRTQRRKRRQMQTLLAVMHQVMDGDPDGSGRKQETQERKD